MMLLLFTLFVAGSANLAFAAPAANLDQLRNGAFDSPVDPANWVNGNIGAQTGQ